MTAPHTAGSLEQLAERVEALTGPDRLTDANIHYLIHPNDFDSDSDFEATDYCYARGGWTLNRADLNFLESVGVRRYTASLDAALSLVPVGCLFTARTVWDKMKPAGLGFVSRYEKGEFSGHERLYWMDEHQAVAATPALALTAACLRARAAQGRG